MSLKLRVLSLAAFAAMSIAALAAMSASANTGGHFVSEADHTLVQQTSNPNSPHQLEFTLEGLVGIVCDEASVEGTANSKTVTQALGSATFPNCHTTGGTPGEIVVDTNGCQALATVAAGDPATTEQTDDLVCPPGKVMLITHPSCLMTVPPQTHLGGFTYTRIIENGKHAITLDVNTKFNVQFHGGICVLLGTNHTATVKGSTIVRGFNTEGNLVGITAT